ncbi:MAG: WG repeat-containing protein [Alistipes sp.]|nr:WG repeat-containing protein [Alistipes sp.]
MAQKEYDIFISYRRVGGADKARILKTELEARGYKVFLDYDELKDGVFDKRIMDAIDSSPIFMFLLTPNSLERCINEDDWVRREIEYAVDNRKHFIPINPDCTFKSLPDNLSDKIKEGLGQHQFTDVMFGQLFNASINELIKDRIRPVLAEWGRVNAASSRGAIVRIEADLDCRILRFGKEIGLAQSGDIAEIKLPKGKHKLQFVGLENSADSYECLLSVEDLEYEDYIEVKLLDKYNARRAKEEAERKVREEAELLGLPDNEFKSFMENGKYGFKVASTGEIIIPLKYDTAWPFHAGLARVRLNGKYAFIDKTDKEVIPLKYDYADNFSEGLANVELNGKYGFIDKTGKEVIPLKYDNAGSFSEGLARVRLNGKHVFIDKTGKEVIPLKYDDARGFSEGLAGVELNGKYGFIDKTGKEVIPLKYDYAYSFSEGLAWVKLNGKWGFIDKTGKEVIPLKYDVAWSFSEGLAAVKLYDKWGFIDKTGKEVIPLKYDYAYPFNGDKAPIELNGECFYIDKNGNRIEE